MSNALTPVPAAAFLCAMRDLAPGSNVRAALKGFLNRAEKQDDAGHTPRLRVVQYGAGHGKHFDAVGLARLIAFERARLVSARRRAQTHPHDARNVALLREWMTAAHATRAQHELLQAFLDEYADVNPDRHAAGAAAAPPPSRQRKRTPPPSPSGSETVYGLPVDEDEDSAAAPARSYTRGRRDGPGVSALQLVTLLVGPDDAMTAVTQLREALGDGCMRQINHVWRVPSLAACTTVIDWCTKHLARTHHRRLGRAKKEEAHALVDSLWRESDTAQEEQEKALAAAHAALYAYYRAADQPLPPARRAAAGETKRKPAKKRRRSGSSDASSSPSRAAASSSGSEIIDIESRGPTRKRARRSRPSEAVPVAAASPPIPRRAPPPPVTGKAPRHLAVARAQPEASPVPTHSSTVDLEMQSTESDGEAQTGPTIPNYEAVIGAVLRSQGATDLHLRQRLNPAQVAALGITAEPIPGTNPQEFVLHFPATSGTPATDAAAVAAGVPGDVDMKPRQQREFLERGLHLLRPLAAVVVSGKLTDNSNNGAAATPPARVPRAGLRRQRGGGAQDTQPALMLRQVLEATAVDAVIDLKLDALPLAPEDTLLLLRFVVAFRAAVNISITRMWHNSMTNERRMLTETHKLFPPTYSPVDALPLVWLFTKPVEVPVDQASKVGVRMEWGLMASASETQPGELTVLFTAPAPRTGAAAAAAAATAPPPTPAESVASPPRRCDHDCTT